MIAAAVLEGALDRHGVERLLDDEDPVLARFVGADRAWVDVGRVEADRAEGDALLHLEDGLGEADGVVLRRLQDVVGKSRGGFGPMPGRRENSSMSRLTGWAVTPPVLVASDMA
jgi:hypothetical protein